MKRISLILLFFILLMGGCGKKSMEELETDSSAVSLNSDDKCYGFGYKKEEKGIIPQIGIYEDYLRDTNSVYLGNTKEKIVYLTFDEGYENGFTNSILDTLKEKQVTAAFFCTGDYIRRNGEIISRMIKEGHIIGNHTWNHPSMPSLGSEEKIRNELKEFDDYLFENHNIKTKYFRYPNGEFSKRTLQVIKDMGYKTVFWSLAYKDWERNVTKGCEYAVNQVTNQLHNGAIILLHAVSEDNAKALPMIIDALINEGYSFGSLDAINF